jgi:hexokinase
MEALKKGFAMSVEECRDLAEGMAKCMNAGLQGLPVDLKMIPSFVVCMPNGSEEGSYYALDLVEFLPFPILLCISANQREIRCLRM